MNHDYCGDGCMSVVTLCVWEIIYHRAVTTDVVAVAAVATTSIPIKVAY